MSYTLEPIGPGRVTRAGQDALYRQPPLPDRSKLSLITELYDHTVSIGAAERARLTLIAALAARAVHEDDDCVDMTQWVAINLGIGSYRARKMVACAHAIEHLPEISRALEQGVLGLDKVVELTRFATPEDESKLITWARKVSVAAIRSRADAETRRAPECVRDATNDRFLRLNLHGDSLWIEGMLPADVGAKIMAALDLLAKGLPEIHSDDRPGANPLEQRRADALIHAVLDDAEAPEITSEVFIHTRLDRQGFTTGVDALSSVLDPVVVERITCDARLRFVLTDDDGNPSGIGRASKVIPGWLRQTVLKAYDFTCCFPGCDHRRGLDVHHLVHWSRGGTTDFDNLAPMCRRHHRLVHEFDWRVFRGSKGTVTWIRPDGYVYAPGPAPPLADIA